MLCASLCCRDVSCQRVIASSVTINTVNLHCNLMFFGSLTQQRGAVNLKEGYYLCAGKFGILSG
jgi:hypothetical protein